MMSSLDYWRTCRFCGVSGHHAQLVKYAERHYAHPNCLIRVRGASCFETMLLFPLMNADLRKEALKQGLTAALDAAIAREQGKVANFRAALAKVAP